MPILIFGEIFEAIFAQQSSGQRTMGVWAKKVGGLGKERGDLGKDGLTSPGPSTSYRCEFKASGVAEEQWRAWLGWRRRAGMGGWAGRGLGGAGSAGLPGRAKQGQQGKGGGPGGLEGWGRAGVLGTSAMSLYPKSCKRFGVKNTRG